MRFGLWSDRIESARGCVHTQSRRVPQINNQLWQLQTPTKHTIHVSETLWIWLVVVLGVVAGILSVLDNCYRPCVANRVPNDLTDGP